MRLRLIGTGSGDGWPNPFCDCSTCEWMRRSGRARIGTSALVDDVLLIDCGPSVPVNASRFGVRLNDVQYLLLSHNHPDHTSPAALLWREFARPDQPLLVAGPAEAVAGWSDWIAPTAPVSFVPLTAGDRVTLGRYAVTAVAATHGGDGSGEALLYVVDDGRHRVLYGTDTAALSDAALEALRDTALDLVLLEETFGDRTDHGTQHLDLATFPEQLERLRDVRAVTTATRVVAVHLSHRNPTEPELSQRLAQWGAEVLDDGTVIDVGAARVGTRVLVTGGARSGKSSFAESLLRAYDEVDYVATGPTVGDDAEWDERVAMHQARRPAGWATHETTDLISLLSKDGAPLLIDCLALWLAAQCDSAGVWEDRDGSRTVLQGAVDALLEAWCSTPRRVVAVTNEVGSGIVPATRSGRIFRDELGRLNARIAEAADQTWLLTAGRPQLLP